MEHKPIRKHIPCSVGVLTYNSERTLRRTLESVKDFCEIIIADGGSTDTTLEIAGEYDCKIVKQSNPGHPIEDFGKERNIMLDSASYDWFFYIDSDEYISKALKQKIQEITTEKSPQHLVYNVRYTKMSPDLTVEYKTFKEYYQTRFFNKRSMARFIKKMHERIDFDTKKYSIGKIEEPWHIVLEDELDYKEYRRKVNYRVERMIAEKHMSGLGALLRRALWAPVKESIKIIIKINAVRIRYGFKNVLPLRYELNRLYMQWVVSKKTILQYKKQSKGPK